MKKVENIYGSGSKISSPITPGLRYKVAFKYWYYVKPSYFFLLNDQVAFWSQSFCVLTTVIQGDRQALEFAEKSLDLGKLLFSWSTIQKTKQMNVMQF